MSYPPLSELQHQLSYDVHFHGICRLLQTLFPLLPRTTSSTLRTFIRKTILSDIRTANLKSKNHKLNRAVQAMLFGMVERGMDGEVQGDKGKLRGHKHIEGLKISGEEAMWAVTLTKELWKKGIWWDTSSFIQWSPLTNATLCVTGMMPNLYLLLHWAAFTPSSKCKVRPYIFF
jgi:SDA1, HEAT repeat